MCHKGFERASFLKTPKPKNWGGDNAECAPYENKGKLILYAALSNAIYKLLNSALLLYIKLHKMEVPE